MDKKRITIIRHGMPEAHHRYAIHTLLKGSDLIELITDWNKCELSSENRIPNKLKVHIDGSGKFITSKLKRAIDSFRLLGIKESESTELLNEGELPYGFLKEIYLPLALWAFLTRLLWVIGFHKNSESCKEFKNRIKKAADYIDGQSHRSDHIVVMGHGFTNMQLKKEIKRKNWKHILNHGGHGYWSFDYFEKTQEGATNRKL
jgi:hypothetical protein